MDTYLVDFMSNNMLSLYVLYTLIKGIALITPSVADDKIVTMIGLIYNAVKSGFSPDRIDVEKGACQCSKK